MHYGASSACWKLQSGGLRNQSYFTSYLKVYSSNLYVQFFISTYFFNSNQNVLSSNKHNMTSAVCLCSFMFLVFLDTNKLYLSLNCLQGWLVFFGMSVLWVPAALQERLKVVLQDADMNAVWACGEMDKQAIWGKVQGTARLAKIVEFALWVDQGGIKYWKYSLLVHGFWRFLFNH